MASTAKVRRALLGAVLAAGMGLMGFSVHGLVSLDTELSNAAQRTAPTQQLPVTDGAAERDCPWQRKRPARDTGFET